MDKPCTEAIYCLLSDDDARAVDLTREQLLLKGEDALPTLRELLSRDDARTTAIVRDLIADIERQSAIRSFDEMARRSGKFDLEDAAWALSRVFDPGLDIGAYRRRLDTWGRQLAPSLQSQSSPAARVASMAHFLGVQLGFNGNVQDYYAPSNSLLSSVVDTRLGIPISLTAVYMLVGRRAGVRVEGVNLPGHFIARHEDILFDPFHQGRALRERDVAELLERQGVPLSRADLSPTPNRLILMRMLANLHNIFKSGEDIETAAMLDRWIQHLDAA